MTSGEGIWNRTPARWEAQFRSGFLGSNWWTVNMNNHTDNGRYDRREDAEREAARMNYSRGSYSPPRVWGLDGVE
jgi:catalase (peroxidase I)